MSDDFSDIATPAPKKPSVKRLPAKPAAPGDDFSDIATPDVAQTPADHQFGLNYVSKDNDQEGRYLMEKDGKIEDVPFSAVAGAMSDGFDVSWTDKNRFNRDHDAFLKKQKTTGPPEGYWQNVGSEVKDVGKGFGSLVTPSTSTPVKVLQASSPLGTGLVAAGRIAKSEVESRSQLADQAVKRAVGAKDIKDPTIKATEGLRSAVSLLTSIVPVPGVAAMADKINETVDRGDIAGGWGILTVDVPLLLSGLKASGKVNAKVADLASKAISHVTEKYHPEAVAVGGTEIPVLQSEAHPESPVGQYTKDTKQRGVAPRKFEKVEQDQQEAVKKVIRDTARETSDFVGPMQAEPGAAMDDAATAVFKTAKPMYKAMDDSLVSVPRDWSAASNLLNTAISRAQKLGVQIDTEGSEPVSVVVDKEGNIIDRREFSSARIEENVMSGEWEEKEMGLSKQPIQHFQAVRSQLLDMQRSALSSGDFNKARVIGDEVRSMNKDAETALKGTDVYKNWREADRLWSKGYALSDVADALNAVTKGTPEGVVSDPNLSPVPTQMHGAGLVARLNSLSDAGVLDRAFTPQQIKNLRTAAYIIDRSQATRVGTSTGETASRSRAITHLLGGSSALPTAGAIAGGLIGAMHGEFLHGAELGTFLGFVGQVVQRRALANAMTTTDGVAALRALSQAKTTTAQTIAMRRLIVAARSATPKQQTQPKKEEKKPDTAPGAQSQLAPTHIFNDEKGEIEPYAA